MVVTTLRVVMKFFAQILVHGWAEGEGKGGVKGLSSRGG